MIDIFSKPLPLSLAAAIARLRAEMDADDADARDAACALDFRRTASHRSATASVAP